MHDDAGSALVSEISKHWNTSEPTARSILKKADLAAVGNGWRKYRWRDIWRLEGELYVPRHDWDDYKAPLLKSSQLGAADPRKRSDRTFRRYIESGRMPVIRLSEDVVRVRACVYEIVVLHI